MAFMEKYSHGYLKNNPGSPNPRTLGRTRGKSATVQLNNRKTEQRQIGRTFRISYDNRYQLEWDGPHPSIDQAATAMVPPELEVEPSSRTMDLLRTYWNKLIGHWAPSKELPPAGPYDAVARLSRAFPKTTFRLRRAGSNPDDQSLTYFQNGGSYMVGGRVRFNPFTPSRLSPGENGPATDNEPVYVLTASQVAQEYADLLIAAKEMEEEVELPSWDQLPQEDRQRFIKAAETVCERVQLGEALRGVLDGMLYENRRRC